MANSQYKFNNVSAAIFITLLLILLLPVHARPTTGSQRLLLILLDGVRHDYLKRSNLPLPGFQKIMEHGVATDSLIPDFPTISFPNYYSIMTGLHTESHDMTGNFMYDVKREETFFLGMTPAHCNAHWWDGGDPLWTTAVRQNPLWPMLLARATSGPGSEGVNPYFVQNRTVYMWYWPGCEVEIRGLRPTWCFPYYGEQSIQHFTHAVQDSLGLLREGKADVAAIYFEKTDKAGHVYGPASPEVNLVLRDLDPVMSDIADKLTSDPGLRDVNLMIFSDHGMTEADTSQEINLDGVLAPSDLHIIMEVGALCSIYTQPGREEQVFEKLRNFHPNMTVYRKSDLPERWHYKRGKHVAPITAVADKGWYISHPVAATLLSFMPRSEGEHGYDNSLEDMHGIFLAMGPAFKANVTAAPVLVVDLYQVMCDILRIEASPNNGSSDRVGPLLADKPMNHAFTFIDVAARNPSSLDTMSDRGPLWNLCPSSDGSSPDRSVETSSVQNTPVQNSFVHSTPGQTFVVQTTPLQNSMVKNTYVQNFEVHTAPAPASLPESEQNWTAGPSVLVGNASAPESRTGRQNAGATPTRSCLTKFVWLFLFLCCYWSESV